MRIFFRTIREIKVKLKWASLSRVSVNAVYEWYRFSSFRIQNHYVLENTPDHWIENKPPRILQTVLEIRISIRSQSEFLHSSEQTAQKYSNIYSAGNFRFPSNAGRCVHVHFENPLFPSMCTWEGDCPGFVFWPAKTNKAKTELLVD